MTFGNSWRRGSEGEGSEGRAIGQEVAHKHRAVGRAPLVSTKIRSKNCRQSIAPAVCKFRQRGPLSRRRRLQTVRHGRPPPMGRRHILGLRPDHREQDWTLDGRLRSDLRLTKAARPTARCCSTSCYRTTFNLLDLGYGRAIANVIFAVSLVLALGYIWLLRPAAEGGGLNDVRRRIGGIVGRHRRRWASLFRRGDRRAAPLARDLPV